MVLWSNMIGSATTGCCEEFWDPEHSSVSLLHWYSNNSTVVWRGRAGNVRAALGPKNNHHLSPRSQLHALSVHTPCWAKEMHHKADRTTIEIFSSRTGSFMYFIIGTICDQSTAPFSSLPIPPVQVHIVDIPLACSWVYMVCIQMRTVHFPQWCDVWKGAAPKELLGF